MNHYITFEQSKNGDKGFTQLRTHQPRSWTEKRWEITENETGGGEPPNHPEDPWVTYYFVTDSEIDEEEAREFAKNLPGSIDWQFNIQR